MSDAVLQRPASDVSSDDVVLPFAVRPLGVRGRVVRLGPALDEIIKRHNYPAPVSALLSEAVALTALLGASLKFEGKLILQTSTDGPVAMIVADFTSPGALRGYARFDKDKLQQAMSDGQLSQGELLGKGHLALTIDQGADMERYQGIVALDGCSLADAAHDYFTRSEQIPTRLRLSAGPLVGRGPQSHDNWRAGAIMVQHLPDEGGISAMPLSSGDTPDGSEDNPPEDDNWVKARVLADTVEDHEVIDPMLSPERLLYRLFHEDGVTVFPQTKLTRQCSCERETVERVLANFSTDEIDDMIEDGEIVVTCEFCSSVYTFDPAGFGDTQGKSQ